MVSSDKHGAERDRGQTALALANDGAEAGVVALHAETATVSRREVSGDVVRVATETTEHAHEIDETIYDERIEIERCPIGREVAADPGIVEHGDLTIVPVMGEIIVTERRLVLIEEIHIRKVRVPRPHRETIMLRTQRAVISRDPQPAHDDTEPPTQPSSIPGDHT